MFVLPVCLDLPALTGWSPNPHPTPSHLPGSIPQKGCWEFPWEESGQPASGPCPASPPHPTQPPSLFWCLLEFPLWKSHRKFSKHLGPGYGPPGLKRPM